MSTVRPFTPTRENPDALEERTVGTDAEEIIDRIAGRIDAARRGNLAHTLVVGPRGAGKTHILAVARHRAERRPGPAPARSVAVPEDGHGIVTFVELLRFIARSLGVDLATLGTASRDVGRLEGAIIEQLDGGILVLAVENLDRLFTKLGVSGQHDLRAWVETCRKVLVLASSPLLFEGVRDRNQPWFGSFTTEYLVELSAEEGSQLLVNLRPEDTQLVDFLRTRPGQARIQALHQLTGGSPRLWTILGDVVTVELLDELVPAVERLLEELVTYYQQRLWDLGPNEERVVTALASGPASRTATQLAEELGLDQKTIGTTLGRLSDTRIVRGRKVAGTDQRSTWYELREPLLRHYLQYRTDGRRELTLIIEMLRHWFDPTALERHLLEAPPGSQVERYVGASLNLGHPISYDDAYDSHSAEGLLLQARRWINDPGATAGFSDAGIVLEGVLGRLGVGSGLRETVPALRALAESVLLERGDSEASTLLAALDSLAEAASGRLADVFRWLAASWRIASDERDAERRLEALQGELADEDDLLAVHVAHDLAYVRGVSNPQPAIEAMQDVVARRRRLQGDLHPDTLLARANVAYFTGEAGGHAGALALHREILADRTGALGPFHPAALTTRSRIAYYTGATGDHAGALALYRELLADQIEAFGRLDARTLVTRAHIAYFTGEAGDHAGAIELNRDLLPDTIEVLGPKHRDTLVTRSQIAYYTAASNDFQGALSLYRDILADMTDALGPRHRDTLITRGHLALCTRKAGDLDGALALYRELLTDQIDVLGPKHRDTLVTRSRIGDGIAEAGDPAGALDLFRELLDDMTDALGPRHRHTLVTRAKIASCVGKFGDPDGAGALYRELLVDVEAALGPLHHDTLVTRFLIARTEADAGRPVDALTTAWGLVRDTEEGAGPSAGVREAATAVFGASLVAVLAQKLTRQVPDEVRRGVLGVLFDAAEGSEQALAQLPAELRTVLENAAVSE